MCSMLTVGSMKRILCQALPRHVWGVVTGVQFPRHVWGVVTGVQCSSYSSIPTPRKGAVGLVAAPPSSQLHGV